VTMRIVPVLGAALGLLVGAGAASADEDGPCPPGTTENVCAAVVALDGLRGTVEELVAEPGTQSSLVVKVDAATRAVLALRVTPALNALDAFDHEVAAAESSGKVSEATSNVMKARDAAAKAAIENVR
jgi:hypothetical protein